ncbi:hypothetical protein D3C84_1092720 [compost metagenome]
MGIQPSSDRLSVDRFQYSRQWENSPQQDGRHCNDRTQPSIPSGNVEQQRGDNNMIHDTDGQRHHHDHGPYAEFFDRQHPFFTSIANIFPIEGLNIR